MSSNPLHMKREIKPTSQVNIFEIPIRLKDKAAFAFKQREEDLTFFLFDVLSSLRSK